MIPTRKMLNAGGKVDAELLHYLREERMAELLADELIEHDPTWRYYEFEETQVNIDIAEIVFDHMVDETLHLLQNY